MYTTLLAGIAFAILFYRAAEYERMSPLLWGLASFALSLAVTALFGRLAMLVVAQVGLFVVMWWYNAFRKQRR